MFDKALIPGLKRFRIPERYRVDHIAGGLRITCLGAPSKDAEATFKPFKSRGATCRRLHATTAEGQDFIIEFGTFGEDYGSEFAGTIRARRPAPVGDLLVLDGPRFRDPPAPLPAIAHLQDQARPRWAEGISYRVEQVDESGKVLRKGLRIPQVGALHAIASHWTLGNEPAIVVMPTGTGKTEVMIAASVASVCARLLVIVPTDALREQTVRKFQRYGLLRKIGVIGNLPAPVVGSLSSRPDRGLFDALRTCNVVVTTMSSIGLAEPAMQEQFALLFSHVFFDEAHHVEAATWKRFQQCCAKSRILLFTATPFREDSRALEGKIIYNFPLSVAQDQGYFNPIHFVEVFEPDHARADQAIADTAVAQLRKDEKAGHDHILMARTATIDAAQKLFSEIYEPNYADFNPVLIHSRISGRRGVLEAIRSGQHRIVICVDMFGEGFDLPSLKVAALHSVHKSLGITLQFIGRFARTDEGVGPATFVANTADDGVPEALEGLYQEDADWNHLVAGLSYDAIDPQARLSELVSNLKSIDPNKEETEISTLALRPKISATAYRTAKFHPERFAPAFRFSQRVFQTQVSKPDNMLVLIVNQSERIDWTSARNIALDTWDLYIAYFDMKRNLLFIHSSRKGDAGMRLARAIAHEPIKLEGEDTFKVFAGLRRLILHSVGLSGQSRSVRYQMLVGLDVSDAIDPLQQRAKMKANVMGVGYERGKRQSIGCSRKGKIWSMSKGSLAEWKSWCDEIGAKLSDPDASPDDFLRYTLVPVAISQLPKTQALMVDWPDYLFESAGFRLQVTSHQGSFDFHDCELALVEWGSPGSFTFALRAGGTFETRFVFSIDPHGSGDSRHRVRRVQGESAQIDVGGTVWEIEEYFNENPPLVRLADGSQLHGSIQLRPPEEWCDVFDRDLIDTLDWSGTDLGKESRWKNGNLREDSIQQRFIEHLEDGVARFIVDDDDQGESADIVAIEEAEDTIIVYLWHCKYSSKREAREQSG